MSALWNVMCILFFAFHGHRHMVRTRRVAFVRPPIGASTEQSEIEQII